MSVYFEYVIHVFSDRSLWVRTLNRFRELVIRSWVSNVQSVEVVHQNADCRVLVIISTTASTGRYVSL